MYKWLKAVVLSALIAGLTVLWAASGVFPAGHVKGLVHDRLPQTFHVNDAASTDIGVDVFYDVHDAMFPYQWYDETIDARAESLNVEDRPRGEAIIGKAFGKYPSRVLKAYLKRVYVLKSLSFYDLEYGGTYANDTLYITLYDDTFTEKAFHHEFSSVLYWYSDKEFDETTFLKYNPNGFSYGGTGVEAIAEGEASLTMDPKYHEQGFMYQYAQSSLENDINSIAEKLFLNAPEFWEVADQYPQIKGKVDVVIAFYHQIDPSFSESYFRNLQ